MERLKQQFLEVSDALELGNPAFRQRFQDFVTPMVFNTEPHDFDTCFDSFKHVAESLIKTI